ncbi:unnamed protein product [Moneuplotes crassus]|uniref:Uncharacterized protein n=1 Tax=Euplotes crassus TaxID=5936 RepID=A0AAD1UKR8_EUPCR|nr:unnamed protein product [Moneuplotes crassus]
MLNKDSEASLACALVGPEDIPIDLDLQWTRSTSQDYEPLSISKMSSCTEEGIMLDFNDCLGYQSSDILFGKDHDKLDLTRQEQQEDPQQKHSDIVECNSKVKVSEQKQSVEKEKEMKNKTISVCTSNELIIKSCSKHAPIDSKKFDIVPFLLERLDPSYHQRIYEEEKSRNRQGRPRLFNNRGKDAILSMIFDRIISKGQRRSDKPRSDSFNASVFRSANKVPDYILKHVGSKCKFKSVNIEEVLESYAEAFTVGYVPTMLAGKPVKDKIKMFCQFIVLSFPKPKVKRIISMLKEAEYLSLDECQNLLHQLKSRKLSSKKSFQNLARQNICFKNIILRLLSSLDSFDIKNKRGLRSVLEKIITK